MMCKNMVFTILFIVSGLMLTTQAKTAYAGVDLMELNEDEEYMEEEFMEEDYELPTDSIIKDDSAKQGNMLIAHYKFDTDLKDASENINDGTIAHGDIMFENGMKGKAAAFDGESYIEVEDNDSLNLDEAFTISVWLYKYEDKNYGYAPILAKGTGTASEASPYALFYDGLSPYLILHNKEERNSLSLYDNFTTKYNEWYMLTVTFDAAKERVNFYLNGAFKGFERWEYGAIYNTYENLYIGFGEIYGEQVFYNGLMDELKIYNYTLGDKEIKSLYNDVVPEQKEYQAINITPNKKAMIKVKGILNITVTGVISNGTKEDITKKATYQSSDENIAIVNNEGKITTLLKGNVTITVTYGKLVKKINITVK
jgi:hypothetical protein